MSVWTLWAIWVSAILFCRQLIRMTTFLFLLVVWNRLRTVAFSGFMINILKSHWR